MFKLAQISLICLIGQSESEVSVREHKYSVLSFVDPDATAGPLIPGMGQIPSGPMLTNQEEGKTIQSYQGSKTFLSTILSQNRTLFL